MLSQYILGAKIIAAVLLVGVLYWYGIHVPAELRETKAKLTQAEAEVENGRKAILLLDEIQKGKVGIDAAVQKRISSIKAGVPHNGVIINGGMPLPSLH